MTAQEEAVILSSFHFFPLKIFKIVIKLQLISLEAGWQASNRQIRARIVRLRSFSSSDFGRVHAHTHNPYVHVLQSLTSSIIVFYILIWFSFVATRYSKWNARDTRKMENGGSKTTNNTRMNAVPSNPIRQTPNVVIECKEKAQRIAGTKNKQRSAIRLKSRNKCDELKRAMRNTANL